jgi:hypothetical protein
VTKKPATMTNLTHCVDDQMMHSIASFMYLASIKGCIYALVTLCLAIRCMNLTYSACSTAITFVVLSAAVE